MRNWFGAFFLINFITIILSHSKVITILSAIGFFVCFIALLVLRYLPEKAPEKKKTLRKPHREIIELDPVNDSYIKNMESRRTESSLWYESAKTLRMFAYMEKCIYRYEYPKVECDVQLDGDCIVASVDGEVVGTAEATEMFRQIYALPHACTLSVFGGERKNIIDTFESAKYGEKGFDDLFLYIDIQETFNESMYIYEE